MNTSQSKLKKVKVQAKFFAKKEAFWGYSKRILTITEDSLIVDSLPFEERSQDIFEFSQLLQIQMSSNNPEEFTISSQVTDPLTAFCSQRTVFLCEFYKAWEQYRYKNSLNPEKSFNHFKITQQISPDRPEFVMNTQLIIFKGHLELKHLGLQGSSDQIEKCIALDKENKLVQEGSNSKILYSDIGTIYKCHTGLIIEMSDSLATHTLLFYDLEKTNQALGLIIRKCKDYTGLEIQVNMDEFEEGNQKEIIEVNSSPEFYFSSRAYKLLQTGHLLPIEIGLSDEQVVEVEAHSGVVIQRYKTESIKDIVRLESQVPGIQIIYEDSTIVTYIPPNQFRGIMTSDLFTIANWKRNTLEHYMLQYDFIHSHKPNYNLLCKGWPKNEIDFNYEIDLIKRFSNPIDDEAFYSALKEFNLNATLHKFTDNESKSLRFLMQLFCKKTKLILCKNFIQISQVFTQYLNQMHIFSFTDEYKGTKDSHKEKLKQFEEQIKLFNQKLQADFANNSITIPEINLRTYPLLLSQVEELLKGITILISSKPMFREIVTNNRQSEFYQGFLGEVSKLFDSPFPTLSHLAGCLFRAFCRFSTADEGKIETLNKHFILSPQVDLIKKISENLAKCVLIKKRRDENFHILSLVSCLRILKTFIYERKETTQQDDLQQIQAYLSKPYYFAIFNFLSRYRSIACVYNTTIIINSFFQTCTTREMYKSLQNKILNNSTLILLHILMAISNNSVLQRKISVILLSNLLGQ